MDDCILCRAPESDPELSRVQVWEDGLWRLSVSVESEVLGFSYLEPAIWSRLTAGQQAVTADPKVFAMVTGIATAPAAATVRIWDLPEGCLRKEDSKPKVYLIAGGAKGWITSPAVLFALGRSWGDVRSVPDGALTGIPDGPDVVMLTTSASPLPLPTNRTVTATVTATDSGSGAPVAGRVLVNGVDTAPTNIAFQHLFRAIRHKVPGSAPPEFEFTYPTVTVRAQGYPDTDVDCGFP